MMTIKKNTRPFWENQDYKFWKETPVGKEGHRIEWSKSLFLQRLLPSLKEKNVLELGCGPGTITPFLARECNSIVGLDFSPKAIEAARIRCADIENASFISGNVLEFEHPQRFDVITGTMFLHEIMHGDTQQFLVRLDSLMAKNGFLYFHENSYFNVLGRFIREHLVGRYGIPKHGSENELPFDRDRFSLYCEFFRYCERYVEGVELAQKVNEYMVPFKHQRVANAALTVDKLLTSFQVRTGKLDNWSYTQTIYASQRVPRLEALGV